MTAGDAVGQITANVANDAYFNIQPSAGVEYCIHSIGHSANCELYLYNGTNYLLIDTGTGAGAWINQTFFITNTLYIAVKNVSGGAATFGYTGIQTK